MSDAAEISEVIGAIYDAAIDARCWETAFRQVCSWAGAHSGGLVLQDFAERSVQVYHWGIGEHLVRVYLALANSNNILRRAWSLRVGETYAGSEVEFADGRTPAAIEQYLSSRIYKEWHKPLGFVDSVQVVLDKTPAALVRLGVNFGEGQLRPHITKEIQARVQLLVPHFRRAVLIGNLLKRQDERITDFACILDRLTTAVVLVNADCVLVYANLAGESLLHRHVISHRHGALHARTVVWRAEVKTALMAAVGGDRLLGTGGIAVPFRASDGERYVAHVLSLSSALRHKLNTVPSAAAALFVQKAEVQTRVSGDVLAALYDLTPAELRVLMAVVDIGSVRKIAAALRISEATVRTHLSHLFDKTDTSRQAELVKLVASFSNQLSV